MSTAVKAVLLIGNTMESEQKPIQIRVTGSGYEAVEIRFADSSEFLRVTPLEHRFFRLDESRAFCFRPSLGDVIEAEANSDGTLQFRRVAKRSGLHQQRYLVSRAQVESEKFKALLGKVTALGGFWEIVCGGLLVLHVPRSVPFAELETAFPS